MDKNQRLFYIHIGDLMDFFASMTFNPGTIKNICSNLEKYEPRRKAIKNILYTPIMVSETTTNIFRLLKKKDKYNVMFDSGGFFVQQGKIDSKELFIKLSEFYSNNKWGDYYVLPDSFPTSSDSDKIVEYKIRDTITNANLFYNQLDSHLQKKCIPVVQGHTKEQILRCIDSYADLNVTRIGFGSFGTSGANNGINIITNKSMEIVEYMMKIVEDYSLEVHAFGVGGTKSMPKLYEAGFTSFDSAGWKRAAGFGDVVFPFHSTHNITHNTSEKRGKILSRDNFAKIKHESNHSCFFCDDFKKLQSSEMYRVLHNLLSISDTCELLNNGHNDCHLDNYFSKNMVQNHYSGCEIS